MIPDHLRENREAHSPALSELVKKYRKQASLHTRRMLVFYIYKSAKKWPLFRRAACWI